jgi:UDP-N-acetylglucosamine--N-acetylmuramyl-(pentapeptide) pyrophosphoryl-undecaprenol N-acetylglucosamine transferase
MEKRERRYLFASGGTGGHIYPAIAVAEELKQMDKDGRILFAGTRKGLERRIVPEAGFDLRFIRVGGLRGKSPGVLLKNLILMPAGLLGSALLLLSFRPHATFGSGGYVTGPVVLLSALFRIPTVIHEQNVIPGTTNRLLSRFADRVAVSFPETAAAFKKDVIVTGNPVRKDFLNIGPRKNKEARHILVFGGSRGALSINRAVISALPILSASGLPLRLTLQTGEAHHAAAADALKQSGIPGEALPFITDMAEKMADADLMICRAGATTIAELNAARRAAVLIPFPQAIHNHQEINARTLARRGCARMILERDLSGESLAQNIMDLCRHPQKLTAMEKAFKEGQGAEAARMISETLVTLAGGRNEAGPDV